MDYDLHLIAKMVGYLFTGIFILVMFIGSLVDIYQFYWIIQRNRASRKKTDYDRIRAEILLEMHNERKNPSDPRK